MEKIMYKYFLRGNELIVRRGIGQISDRTGDLIDFVYEDAKGTNRSHCNRYMKIPIDKDGYYKSSVYLEECDLKKAISILLKNQEILSFNYKNVYEESERKVKYLKNLLREQESKS